MKQKLFNLVYQNRFNLIAIIILVILQSIILQTGFLLSTVGELSYIIRPPKIFYVYQNIAILLAINLVFWALFRNFWSSAIFVTFIYIIFMLCGLIKMYYLTDPILHSDFELIQAGIIAIIPFITVINIIIAVLIILFVATIAFFLNKIFPRPKLKLINGVWMIIFACILATSSVWFINNVASLADASMYNTFPKRTYRIYGVPYTLINFALKGKQFEPKSNYTKENIQKICQTILVDYAHKDQLSANTLKPNVLLLVQESMFDPIKLDSALTVDPVPHIRKQHQEKGAIHPISPTFGGGSWQTDFEVSSGISSIIMLDNAKQSKGIALKNPIPAIPFFLKQFGYESHALLPCSTSLFNYRSLMNTILGYENYLELSELFPEYHYMHQIKDDMVYEKTLNLLKANQDTPLLLYVQFLENHWPYNPKPPLDVEFSKKISSINNQSSEYYEYILRVNATDHRLHTFLEEVKKLKRPTLVYSYGDHVPPFSTPTQRFLNISYTEAELKKLKKSSDCLLIPRYMTLGLYWSNNVKTDSIPEHFSHFFISSYLYRDLNVSHPFYTHFLPKLNEYFTAVLKGQMLLTPTGELIKELPPEGKKLFEMYDLIIFDLCYGEQYSVPYLFKELSVKE